MPRLVRRHPTFFGIALLVAAAVPFLVRFTSSMAMKTALAPIAGTDAASTLIRAGLDPDALAAAGVSGNQAAGVVDAFEAAMAADPARLATADAGYASAKAASDQLRRLIQSGRGDQGDVTKYQAAMSSLQTAEASRQSALDDWFDAATTGLTQGQVATLVTIKGNRDWKLDIEFLTVDRSEPEWVQLRDALAHERVAAKYGESVDPGVQSFLATARSNASVSASKTACAANLSAVTASWEGALQ
jgi:hypothetical protein